MLAVKGSAALSIAGSCGTTLDGKLVLDTTNPLADKPPVDGILETFTGPNDSLIERLQKQHPKARFVSTDVISRGGDNYQARGKLTIREVTRDVTLPFSLRIQNGLATARGTLDIKRLDYGIGRNEWASTNYVADTVTIELTVVASRP